MKKQLCFRYNRIKLSRFLILLVACVSFVDSVYSQSYTVWYNEAQQRIDTLRKGNFGLKIIDKYGQPYTGEISVRMKKHEFPFGIACDFYEGSASMGNSYSTASVIQAVSDKEIYRTERWGSNLAYAIPVQKGKEYKLTLKFAEIYFASRGSRLFDVTVNGQLFLDDYDVFNAAGGKDIAVDVSKNVVAEDGYIYIELNAIKDNASIKGISISETNGVNVLRINCGGSAITTSNGNYYTSEVGYFDSEANSVSSNEQWMQAAMLKYFNYAVTGNSFKWSGVQPQHTTPNYSNFENVLRWTQKVGWDLRAHTLLWGGNDAHSTPDWVRALPTPKAITDTCKMRVQREVLRYKGIIKEYDVINEPLTGHADWLRKTVGDSILWNCFKWAREVDPNADLYINDYNVEYNWGQAYEYRDLIKRIRSNGGPVTGVGIQSHFWDCCRPSVDEFVRNLNIIAEAGLPIRLTEYDWGKNLTEEQQVEDFVKVMTVAFSHPSVNGMICWGLNDVGAWRENSGFFTSNRKPKLAADTLLHYTQKKWATNFDSHLSGTNSLDFNAYYGDYEVMVNLGGNLKVFTLPCIKANRDSVFILREEDASLKGPLLVKREFVDSKTIRLVFDKPIESTSLKRRNFKFFSNTKIGLSSVQPDPINQNAIMLYLNSSITTGDYVSVAYYPGNLLAVDGSKAGPFGPLAINIYDTTSALQSVAEHTLIVFPNPVKTVLNVKFEKVPYIISIYNNLGIQVYLEKTHIENHRVDVSKFAKGFYLLKIQDSLNDITTKKVMVE